MKHELYKIQIDDLNIADLKTRLVSFLYSSKTNCIATPNAEMLVDAIRDTGNPPESPLGKGGGSFRKELQNMDLNLPDGVALRFAISALTDRNLKNRHTGVDTLQELIELCAQEGKSVMFFGPNRIVSKNAIDNLQTKVKISAVDPGVIQLDRKGLAIDQKFINLINKIKPDVIAIALPHKKQLAFMNQYKNELSGVKIMIGVGGAIDMFAGRQKRAPKWMQKIGMEWLWRVLIEPRRIGRIAKASIAFPVIVALDTIRQRRFIKAIRNTAPEIIKQLLGK